MALKLITVSGSEPVTLAEIKTAANIDADLTGLDDYLTALGKAARSSAEQYMNRIIVAQQFERSLDAFPDSDGGIQLAWPYVTTVDSVAYTDENGDSQTLSSALYTLDNRELPGWVLPIEDTVWPTTLDTAGAVRVTFTSGWGEGSVPEDVKTFIKMRVATLYRNREQVGANMTELPRDFTLGLLDRWCVYYGG